MPKVTLVQTLYPSKPSSVAPTTSERPSFEARRKRGHEFKHYWTIDAIDEYKEKIEAHSSQQAMESTVNSPLHALGVVLGKDHCGHVRGLGMGAIPTVIFKNNTRRISQMNLGSSNDADTSSTCGPNGARRAGYR
ncbi:hypothetical protein Ahy_A06g028092 [Arachis hypogaea]|uniref:Uncharacterized protein n=1 Tax=Arachis hypogaea TaxID=3818 RepID=A0A445CQB2_ARAHY|nr:hypothetical protein Ahy_A06g028092 [Arachis hypogaea]